MPGWKKLINSFSLDGTHSFLIIKVFSTDNYMLKG